MKFKELLPLLPSYVSLNVHYDNGKELLDVRLASKFTKLLNKEITYMAPQVYLDTNTIENDQVSVFGVAKLEIVLK